MNVLVCSLAWAIAASIVVCATHGNNDDRSMANIASRILTIRLKEAQDIANWKFTTVLETLSSAERTVCGNYIMSRQTGVGNRDADISDILSAGQMGAALERLEP
jgi:hypothetical protein